MANPKTKLPKVWVVMTDSASKGDGRYFYGREGARRARKTWESVRQYAPVQPPRKCVWTLEDDYVRTQCGELYPYGFNYSHCPNCAGKPDPGGKITRRSPR